jgi:protein-S-isoprenylcysteine O-methyltransferase Ste14
MFKFMDMFAFKGKEERMNGLKTLMIGGTFIMLLWVGLPFLVYKFIDPRLHFLKFNPMRWLGLALNTAGYILAVWCVMLFIKEGRGTPLPYAYPKQLVCTGPYRFVRNPMVIGTVLFLFGNAVFLGSAGIFIYTLCVCGVMHFFVLVEESSLSKRFGEVYDSYCRKTPRWWPKF